MIQFALMAVAANKLGLERVKAVGRVIAYSGGVAIVLGAIGAHKARAAVNETGFQVAEDLAAVAPFLKKGSTLNVNGQRVHFSSTETAEGATAILDKFQAACEQADGGDAAVWSTIPTTPQQLKATKVNDLTKMPILRQQHGRTGYIACLVSSTKMTTDAFRAATVSFIESHNSLQLGRLRYATVKESATGSTVTTVWTDDNFDIGALIPDPDHDAPGIDPQVMQRPGSSTRMLSGTVEQLPYKVYLYDTKQSPKEAIDAYDAQMIAQNWVSIQVPQTVGAPHDGAEVRAYMRNGFVGYVTATTSPKGSTMIGVGEAAGVAMTKENSKLSDADGF